jgi:tRNA-specific adenosine deaminase 3
MAAAARALAAAAAVPAADAPAPLVETRASPGRGRGVFALRDIPSRSTLDVSPVLVFSAAEYESHARHTLLREYCFVWRDGRGAPSMALCLGRGSIFNHAREPNAGWLCDVAAGEIRFVTLRDVCAGEELFICYGRHLWFDDVDGDDGSESDGGSFDDDGSPLPLPPTDD